MASEHDTRAQEADPGAEGHPGGAPAAEPEAPVGPPATPAGAEAATAPAPEASAPAAEPAAEPAVEPAAESPAEHERRLELDLEELTARAEMADEYLELAKRTKADFENYRKRAARESATAQERGVAKLARELLPAVDNLDRALAAAETTDNGVATLVDGIKLVHADVLAALQRAGIERFSPEGEVFDPQHHEAIAQHPVEGAQPGTIVEVYQQGYRLGESVIRPARVVVAG
jgi:molecular chaperone GrpE